MKSIRKFEKLAIDLSSETTIVFVKIMEKLKKSSNDDEKSRLLSAALKACLRCKVLIMLETPTRPVKTVDEVLVQVLDEVREIEQEFRGSNDLFLIFFMMELQRVRYKMRATVRRHEMNRKGRIDQTLHQRYAYHFRRVFYTELFTFISNY